MTTLDHQAIADEITAKLKAVAVAQPQHAVAFTAGAAGASVDFCSIWVTAKPILSAVGGIIMFIPGMGTTAGVVLQELIKVGDQIYSQTCNK